MVYNLVRILCWSILYDWNALIWKLDFPSGIWLLVVHVSQDQLASWRTPTYLTDIWPTLSENRKMPFFRPTRWRNTKRSCLKRVDFLGILRIPINSKFHGPISMTSVARKNQIKSNKIATELNVPNPESLFQIPKIPISTSRPYTKIYSHISKFRFSIFCSQAIQL